MTDNQIADKVKKVLVEWFEVEPGTIVPEVRLRDDLDFDSLDTVDFVVALEKEFGFKIVRSRDESLIRALLTLNDVYNFVKDKLDNPAQ